MFDNKVEYFYYFKNTFSELKRLVSLWLKIPSKNILLYLNGKNKYYGNTCFCCLANQTKYFQVKILPNEPYDIIIKPINTLGDEDNEVSCNFFYDKKVTINSSLSFKDIINLIEVQLELYYDKENFVLKLYRYDDKYEKIDEEDIYEGDEFILKILANAKKIENNYKRKKTFVIFAKVYEQTFSLNVTKYTILSEIKILMESKVNIPIDYQKIIFNRKQLDDDGESIENYNIEEGSTLYILSKL